MDNNKYWRKMVFFRVKIGKLALHLPSTREIIQPRIIAPVYWHWTVSYFVTLLNSLLAFANKSLRCSKWHSLMTSWVYYIWIVLIPKILRLASECRKAAFRNLRIICFSVVNQNCLRYYTIQKYSCAILISNTAQQQTSYKNTLINLNQPKGQWFFLDSVRFNYFLTCITSLYNFPYRKSSTTINI